jgi:hypothetical protein
MPIAKHICMGKYAMLTMRDFEKTRLKRLVHKHIMPKYCTYPFLFNPFSMNVEIPYATKNIINEYRTIKNIVFTCGIITSDKKNEKSRRMYSVRLDLFKKIAQITDSIGVSTIME